jgi:DNA-directed RNA polymerase specialized sigma24 family protein
MDRAAAIAELPEAYGAAIRLAEDGADDKTIAERLGIADEAVGPMLRVARAKLAHALTTTGQEVQEEIV